MGMIAKAATIGKGAMAGGTGIGTAGDTGAASIAVGMEVGMVIMAGQADTMAETEEVGGDDAIRINSSPPLLALIFRYRLS